jgi:hypothetical protein
MRQGFVPLSMYWENEATLSIETDKVKLEASPFLNMFIPVEKK